MTDPVPLTERLQKLGLPFTVLSAVFVADTLHATLLTPALLYPIAVLVTVDIDDPAVPRLIAAVGSALTVIGRFVPRPEALPTIDLANRVMSVVALWATAALVLHMSRFQRKLRKGEAIAEQAQVLRVQTQQRLELSLHELHDMKFALDQSCIVSITDVTGAITYVNERFCDVSGYARDELLGQNHRMINSGLHTPDFFATLWNVVSHGGIWRGEVRNRSKYNTFWWADTTIVPVLEADGTPKQYVAIRSNITARKDVEERLRDQASLAKLGAMASVIAHEVRNPLAGVSGAMQVLRSRMAAESEEWMIIGDVLERVDQLNASLSDLLIYARPQPLHKAPTNLRQLLDDVVDASAADPRVAGVAITAEGSNSMCTVDANLVRGAVFNLALNAAQALKGRGRIRLIKECNGHNCTIRVQDDGPGIDKAVLERMFEPFFTTKSRGTGLGLSIVKRVVEQHGGEIRVECPATGGTVVHLVFPL